MNRAVLSITLFAAACSSSAKPVLPPHDAGSHAVPDGDAITLAEHKDEPEEHEQLPDKVRLTPKVVQAAGIKSAPAVQAVLPQTVNLTGEIISDPDRTADVTARVPGRIVEVRFKEGIRVKSGDVLVVIESPEIARARALVSAAQAKAQSARQNANRLASVAQKGLAAGQEVATADAEAAALEAEARAARQTLTAFGSAVAEVSGDSARLALRAPIAGVVLSRSAVRGQTVTADHVLASIADLDRAYFTARLFEKDLARVREGAAAEVRLNAYANDVFLGTVETVGKALDPTARTVLARIVVHDQRGLLKVGLFGNALVVIPDSVPRTARVVLPIGAVTKIADRDVVFVAHPDGDFEVHRVTLGRSAGGRVEILSGLREGEQVVVEGVFTLKSTILKGTFGEED